MNGKTATWAQMIGTVVNVAALVAAVTIYFARIGPQIESIVTQMADLKAEVVKIREKPVPDWLMERIEAEHTAMRERLVRLEDRVLFTQSPKR